MYAKHIPGALLKWGAVLAALFGVSLAASGGRATPGRELSPKEILDRVDDVYRGKSAHGKMTMKVVTEHWSRELKLEFWAKGTDRSLFRILSPRKEKGTSTLMVGKNIWNYLPKVNRVIKLPSSMMGGSWMGSHFTNDDLVKQSRMAEDYSFKLGSEGTRKGRNVTEIVCTPKPNAAVVWGKVVVLVEQGTYLPLKIDYFDEDLKKARTMTFSGVKTMAGRTLPTVVRIIPRDKPQEMTEVVYDEIAYDVGLSDSFFSRRSLQR